MSVEVSVLGSYRELDSYNKDGAFIKPKQLVPWKYIEGIRSEDGEEDFDRDTNKYYRTADFMAAYILGGEHETATQSGSMD